MDEIDIIENDIKSLKIQGATNIALATLQGLKIALEKGVDESRLRHIGTQLAYARPTEPLAQNSLRFIFSEPNQTSSYISKIEEYKSYLIDSKEKMSDSAKELINNGGIYLTHCHSSSVTSMFVRANKQGKKFSVYATETRPMLQGHITIRELLDAGIEDVTLVVDDVVSSLLENKTRHIDAVLIGADMLLLNGFINKVGSLEIVYAAKRNKIPIYCLSVLLKFSSELFSDNLLDERGGSEIWPDAPAKLKFYAPAFDFVPYDENIHIICEEGIIERNEIKKHAVDLYPFISQLR